MRIPSSLRRVLCCVLAAALVGAASAQQPPPPPVVVATLVDKTLSVRQTFTGTAIATRTSIVGSAVDGRVEQVSENLDEGKMVGMVNESGQEKGEPLVQLRTATINLELSAAEAELDARTAELHQLQESLPQQIAQAKAKVASAAALMEYAQSRFRRVQRLHDGSEGSAVSIEQLEEAKSAEAAAEQDHAAAVAALQELVGTEQSRLALARARQMSQQLEVERQRDILAKYTIRAPFKGFVVTKQTEVGAWLSRGDPVAEVIEIDPIEIEVFVPEQHIAKVELGETVDILVDGLPDKVVFGVVSRIIPKADPRSRSFPVRIRVQNSDYAIKAGMLVRASIPVGDPQALLAPKDALVLDRDRRSVVVARANPETGAISAEFVPVETGLAEKDWIEVKGELREGDQVVVRGNERLRPGQALRIIGRAPQPEAGQ